MPLPFDSQGDLAVIAAVFVSTASFAAVSNPPVPVQGLGDAGRGVVGAGRGSSQG